jgi:hypothetical protein
MTDLGKAEANGVGGGDILSYDRKSAIGSVRVRNGKVPAVTGVFACLAG